MLKEKTKVIEINEKKYRLTKLDARSGSYLAMKIAMIAAPALGKGKISNESMTSIVASMSRKEFDELQTMLLVRVQKLVGADEVPMPIVKANGVFVDDDLEYDVATVINLTVQCIMFNIGDFFNVAGLMQTPAK